MQGLDLQPARRFQRLGEQGPGAWQIMRRLVDLFEIGAQVAVTADRPFAELIEQALLHFGGGGLGIGDAQNALRFRAIEQ